MQTMNKLTLTATLLASLLLPAQAATEIAGVAVTDTIELQGKPLTLSGAGIRSKFFMDLYVGSLYSSEPGLDDQQAIEGNQTSAIRLNIVSGLITSDKMIDSIEEGFQGSAGKHYGQLKPKIDAFIAVFSDQIVEGDQFTLLSLPGVGVEAYKNGQLLTLIEGEAFRQALLGIWLGDKPADDDLKEAMLGG
ncbi:chalcone isomerase [Ferrimonas sediminicola]|uniref:Chalcone isomerase n=2 Tax=Ferrimonas sediminicola TaxID=2569538 RepID=A0A4U1BLS3_9GAMM|nr:chalcone isomerase family protein [Ferrimonas sediminicola]TKB51607.1 chalcone isomerase [Ferrimonas sediminicola]